MSFDTQHSYSEFMNNKFHGVKFPKNKKGYLKLSEEMISFYQELL